MRVGQIPSPESESPRSGLWLGAEARNANGSGRRVAEEGSCKYVIEFGETLTRLFV